MQHPELYFRPSFRNLTIAKSQITTYQMYLCLIIQHSYLYYNKFLSNHLNWNHNILRIDCQQLRTLGSTASSPNHFASCIHRTLDLRGRKKWCIRIKKYFSVTVIDFFGFLQYILGNTQIKIPVRVSTLLKAFSEKEKKPRRTPVLRGFVWQRLIILIQGTDF